MNKLPFGKFSTPFEDYSKELKKVKTFEDLMRLKEKYFSILDDAEGVYNSITPENFGEFMTGLPEATDKNAVKIDEVWAGKYGAIVLPRLFLQIVQFFDGGMGSGFLMHRLIEAKRAKIENGRFRIL